jgi:hypothetical protein
MELVLVLRLRRVRGGGRDERRPRQLRRYMLEWKCNR